MRHCKKPLFKGVATALATPFSCGEVDIAALRRMLIHQVSSGVDAIVLCGTTGEAPTLTEDEMIAILTCARQTVGNDFPLIMGTGTNSTAVTVRRSRAAEKHGASALLVVTPYYNKGTREGLVKHYLTVADSVDIPIIVYNVPKRTGVDISLDALKVLSAHPRIVGIKEASGDFDKMAECMRQFGDHFSLYCGNDSQILATLALGGAGVISVVSNVLPRMTGKICHAFFEGDHQGALEKQLDLLPFIRALFAETNPAPIKAALEASGLCDGSLRLPLDEVPTELKEFLRRELSSLLQKEKSI